MSHDGRSRRKRKETSDAGHEVAPVSPQGALTDRFAGVSVIRVAAAFAA